ncbi:family 20 glycosylhydrolase [Pontibacter sp. G13]|uniref:family 20 glycosylhydrolase n=1 Tax=Pontibacter sp. G13 TaxID=3074898 RepID=UPI00288B30B4|nr:family 20 glycosylhydrolase [Pontibacter sp. G13]WNJ21324.1 family 20 glycosylhydrolase [Pontibacter sp. G13]
MFRLLTTMLLAAILGGCAQPDSEQSHSGTAPFSVKWTLLSNTDPSVDGHKAQFILTSTASDTLGADWVMYWNMVPRSFRKQPEGLPITLTWINGDYYKMEPQPGFSLAPGASITIPYEGSAFMIKESDAPCGLFVVDRNDKGVESHPRPITAYEVTPFTEPEQIDRYADDFAEIPTATTRFANNQSQSKLTEEELIPIVPTPREFTRGAGTVTLTQQTQVVYAEGMKLSAELLAAQLTELFGKVIGIEQGNEAREGQIFLGLNSGDPESYRLSIQAGQAIEILGADRAGAFYGSQSLLALLPPAAFAVPMSEMTLMEVEVEDAPAFPYRGMHLDVARNFHSKATVKKLIDAMAFYKLNKLHLHLTEDEGWRLEIQALPELTEIGGFRGHSQNPNQRLLPAYGSGPFADPSDSWGSGYYTRGDYQEIIRYAWDRNIEVIPEINIPAHARAAIIAMEARYDRFMEAGDPAAAEEYRLADPEDASEYRSAQWWTDNVICVCKPSAMKFVNTVLTELIDMYQEVDVPLTMVHTGGDEVPRGAWAGSPICEEFLQSHPEVDNPQNLQIYFFRQVVDLFKSKGVETAGWEEIAMDFQTDGSWTANEEFSGQSVVPYIWNSLWGNQDLGYRLANAGYPVVLCNVSNYYFDLAYDKDPLEPGLYWGGFVNTRDAYVYDPLDLFSTTLEEANSRPIDPVKEYAKMERLTETARNNVLGIQAQLWSETVKGPEMVDYYIYPKILGLAERAWYGVPKWSKSGDPAVREQQINADWNRFANTLGQREFPRLDHMSGGISYRIDVPGIQIDGGLLHINTQFPGLEVRYTMDGSEPTADSPIYDGPVPFTGNIVKARAFSSSGRAGRTSTWAAPLWNQTESQ